MSLHLINPITIRPVIDFLSKMEIGLRSKKSLKNKELLIHNQIKVLQKHWQRFLISPLNISLIDNIERELEMIIDSAKIIYLMLNMKVKKQLIKSLDFVESVEKNNHTHSAHHFDTLPFFNSINHNMTS